MGREIQTVPADWLQDVRDAIENPAQFKYTGWPVTEDKRIKSVRENIVIPAILIEQFDRFHSRGVMHSKTKGEHEAAGLLNFYIVWKFKLFLAEYKSWDEYVRDVTNAPFSISSSSLKQGVSNIDALIQRGTTIDNVISLMGLVPTAARILSDVPNEQIPGGDINSAAEMIIELGSSEAIATVNDWTGKASFTGLNAVHDQVQERLYLEVRRTRIDGSWQRLDWMIQNIDVESATWVMERCGIRSAERVFK